MGFRAFGNVKWVLGLAMLVLASCDEEPAGGPTPATPIANLAPPPPRQTPLGPKPIKAAELLYGEPEPEGAVRVNDGGQGPGAEDLGGPYEVIVSAFKPWAQETDVNSLKGDATGAIAVESSSGPRGQAHRSEYRVSADEALSFFTSLNPLTWWTLGDETGAARDGTQFTVELRRGGFRHTYKMDSTCGCKPPCACRQSELMSALDRFIEKQRDKEHEKAPAPKVEAFKPPILKGKPQDCSEEQCRQVRCFKQGSSLACFNSPLDGKGGILVKPGKGSPAAHKPLKDENFVWAFELDNGTRCFGPGEPVERPDWKCTDTAEGEYQTEPEIMTRGKARVASFDGWRRRITRLWK